MGQFIDFPLEIMIQITQYIRILVLEKREEAVLQFICLCGLMLEDQEVVLALDLQLQLQKTDLLHYKVLKSIKSLLLTLCCQKDRHRLLGKRQSNPIIIKSCWQDAVKVETEVFYPDQEDLQVLC